MSKNYEVDSKDTAIIFRRMLPVPWCLESLEGIECWHVFIYSDAPWPEGIATVVDTRKCPGHTCPNVAYRYLLLNDPREDEDDGVRILKACLRRWPDIVWGSFTEDDPDLPILREVIGPKAALALTETTVPPHE